MLKESWCQSVILTHRDRHRRGVVLVQRGCASNLRNFKIFVIHYLFFKLPVKKSLRYVDRLRFNVLVNDRYVWAVKLQVVDFLRVNFVLLFLWLYLMDSFIWSESWMVRFRINYWMFLLWFIRSLSKCHGKASARSWRLHQGVWFVTTRLEGP
jgi:hypothetical protein